MSQLQKVYHAREKINIRGVQSLSTEGITPGKWFEAQPNRRQLMLAAWNLVDVEWPTSAVPTIVGVNVIRIANANGSGSGGGNGTSTGTGTAITNTAAGTTGTNNTNTGFRRGQYILARCPQGHIAQLHLTRRVTCCGTCTLRRQLLPIHSMLVELFGDVWFCYRDSIVSPPLRMIVTSGEPYCRKMLGNGIEFLHVNLRKNKMRQYLIGALQMYPRAEISICINIDAPVDTTAKSAVGAVADTTETKLVAPAPADTSGLLYEDHISNWDRELLGRILK